MSASPRATSISRPSSSSLSFSEGELVPTGPFGPILRPQWPPAFYHDCELVASFGLGDVERVRSLGAREVLDRLREDFTKNGTTYDLIFDAVGKHSFRRRRGSLKPGGIYITVDLGYMYHVPPLALITRFVGSRRAKLGIGRHRKEDLVLVRELVDAAKYRPVDRRYALDEVVEATRYVVREVAPRRRQPDMAWLLFADQTCHYAWIV